MTIWHMNKGVNSSVLGIIPQMLSENDPRDAIDQLDTGYKHGGGWQDFYGFELTGTPGEYAITYPEDPPYKQYAHCKFRDDYIVVFPYSWVAVVKPDNTFRVCRMD